jgi:small acid-soluble spore protein A (major alpha-type SASP)
VHDFFIPVHSIFHKEVLVMPNNNSGNSNQLLVPGVRQALDQMKNEIASEFGVQMGPDATSRANGSVGGEITKRLVRQAQSQMSGQQNNL